MDEPAVPQVDAHVRVRPAQGVEEHQIARPDRVGRHGAGALGDAGGVVGQLAAAYLLDDVAHHPAAIEPGFRVLAAETIARVQEAERVKHDLLGVVVAGQGKPVAICRRASVRLAGVGGLADRCLAAASQKRRKQQQRRAPFRP